MVSQGLQMLLSTTFDVVGNVTDGQALVDATVQLNPDVIVSDISMPVLNGMDALRQLRSKNYDTKVIFVTMHTDAQLAVEAFRSGVTGYVLKHAAGDELIAAIQASLQGRTYLTPLIAREVLQLLLNSSTEPKHQCGIECDEEALMKIFGVQTTSELIQLATQIAQTR
jgi:DNA-binding NarL/FixJ family response regulator